ncbi:hypothetical protein E2C01_040246 [Portunus trituberculatus]|uniref:Uncharacterized protein n=1 Tax=Portunus trituberculatus TaxID=210409 RepID=A0A5B7FM48_PORTR|nr:hypothetical protein [Portunus trituberculatus]
MGRLKAWQNLNPLFSGKYKKLLEEYGSKDYSRLLLQDLFACIGGRWCYSTWERVGVSGPGRDSAVDFVGYTRRPCSQEAAYLQGCNLRGDPLHYIDQASRENGVSEHRIFPLQISSTHASLALVITPLQATNFSFPRARIPYDGSAAAKVV